MEQRDHANDIQLATLEQDGEKLIAALEKGSMVAIVSGSEIMYVFVQDGSYLCYIHALDAPEGRCRAFPRDVEHRAVIKNLAQLSDQLFEVEYKPGMERMGVMFTAEQGIVQYLDVTGKLPIEDVDFMSAYETPASEEDGAETRAEEGKQA